MSEGAWIFLSHSHKDFDQVRAVRNELENLGHHPLMFFLKCLNDDSEIDDLVRREIRARSWFLLCDSANSKASHWVQQERNIIRSLPEHNSATINLADPLKDQMDSLGALTKCASVFLSYSHADRDTALQIEGALRREDFGVFSDLQLSPSANWEQEIQMALDRAVRKGAVLVLLSQSAIRSKFQLQEIQFAFERRDPSQRKTNILPVFLEAPSIIFPLAPPWLREIKGFDFSSAEFSQNMQQLMHALRSHQWDAS